MYSRLLPGLSAFVSIAAPAWRMVGVCRFAFSSGKKTPTGKVGTTRAAMKAKTDIEGINLSKAGSKRTQRATDSTKGNAVEAADTIQKSSMSDLEQLKAKILLLESPPVEAQPKPSDPQESLEAPIQQSEDIPDEEDGGVKEGTVTAKSEDGEEYELPPVSQQFKPGEVGQS